MSDTEPANNYPTLYSRDKIGHIRIWHMERNGNKYRTVAGIQNGETVASEWTTVYGKNAGKKNATTDTEQAIKEIKSKYTQQMKTGYYENIQDIDKQAYIEPSLAKDLKDYVNKLDLQCGEWGLQCKLNGLRCIATKKGMFTRKGEHYISTPHIHENLQAFFEQYPEAVLDGELFNHDLRQHLNEIVRLARKTIKITPEDLAKSAALIKYYIYDGYGFSGLGQNTPYHIRKEFIDKNVITNYDQTRLVHTDIVASEENLMHLYNKYIELGHEGGILRNLQTHYINGRSKHLLKMKPTDDDEFKIIAITDGKGNWSGKAKNITVQMPNGKIFDAVFKGTFEQGIQCLAEADIWIGKTVTIQYNGFTGLGTPNYAQFDYANSTKGDR